MARVEINPDWRQMTRGEWREFAREELGPDVADDARRYAPVRTGALKASIEDHLEGDDLIVSATGGGEDEAGNLFVSRRPGKPSAEGGTHANPGMNPGETTTREVHHVDEAGQAYAAYVELGHRVHHPGTDTNGPEVVPAQPFLRPALFKHRGGP